MSKVLKGLGVNIPNAPSQGSHLTAFAGSLNDPLMNGRLSTNAPSMVYRWLGLQLKNLKVYIPQSAY